MKLAVITNEKLTGALPGMQIPNHAKLCVVAAPQYVPADSDMVFDLLFEHTAERVSQLQPFLPRPVFINAVTTTLAAINQPFIRINAWPGFLERGMAEVAALPGHEQTARQALDQLGWNYRLVADITGMISARIISTIINEAYYTLNQQVSTKEEIDIAMKLGTNYPYGPFEWSKKIGIQNIYTLLVQLSKENSLYEVSTLLTDEIII